MQFWLLLLSAMISPYCAGGADYTVISSQTITFSPGETEAFLSVGTAVDSLDDDSETFTATLSSPTGAELGSVSMANVFIRDRKGIHSYPDEWIQTLFIVDSSQRPAVLLLHH